MPSAPSPTQAKNATSAMLCRVRVSRGSSGLPKSLRLRAASGMSAVAPGFELLFDPAREHRHLLGGLLVAFALGDGDAFAVGGERVGEASAVGEGLAEQLPRRGIPGVAAHRFAQLRGGAVGIAGLEIFVAQRVS